MLQERTNGKATPSRLTFSIIFLTSVFSTFFAMAVIYAFSNMRVGISDFSNSDCYSMGDGTVCFFRNNMESDGMISVLSTFYTNLIVIMVALLTLIGIIAALSIRYSEKQHVEAELPELTSSYFTNGQGKNLLAEGFTMASKDLNDRIRTLDEKIGWQYDYLVDFNGKLIELQKEVDSVDSGQVVVLPDDTEEDEDYG